MATAAEVEQRVRHNFAQLIHSQHTCILDAISPLNCLGCLVYAGEMHRTVAQVQELERSLLEERRKNEALNQKVTDLQCSSEVR